MYTTNQERLDYCIDSKNASKEHDVVGFLSTRDSEPCVICHAEKFTISRRLRCGHSYCFRCITEWIRENPSCPLCREEQYNLNWPSVCIACGDTNCQNSHVDLDHDICIELI
jgi:hypothetical protein